MTKEHIKIVNRSNTFEEFVNNYADEKGLIRLIGALILKIPKSIYQKISRPFRNSDYNAYTTKEKLNWYTEKGKAISNSAYVKLSDYVEAPALKKVLSKEFSSFASHKIADRTIEQAVDYSNDPNIVPVPKPKPFFGKQKKLNRPQN